MKVWPRRALPTLALLAGAAALAACASILGIQDITDDGADGSPFDAPPADAPAPDAAGDAPPPSDAPQGDAPPGDAPACDAASDPNNCGQCGHSCQGGACTGGVCQPYVVATTPNARSIAADETNVYWTISTATGAVMQAAVTGAGGSRTIAGSQPQPMEVRVNGATVYFTDLNAGASELRAVPVGGGSVQVLRSIGTSTPNGLAAGPNAWVFFTTFASAAYALHAQTPDGGIDYPSTPGQVLGIAADNGHAYFTDTVGGYVLELVEGQMNSSIILSGRRAPQAIAMAGTQIAWVEPGSAGMTTGAVLAYTPGSGGSPTTVQMGLASPRGIAGDTADVYWTDGLDNTVYKAPLAGGARTPLATGQEAPDAIAVSSTRVFWINDTSGAVMAVAK